MGILDKLRNRREQTQIGSAERARDRDEERQIAENARREGKLEGLKKGARARGEREGIAKAEGRSGVSGFLKGLAAPQTHTVTTRRTVGKGKNRHTVTTTRQVKGKSGLSNGLEGLGFGGIGGPSSSAFDLHPSMTGSGSRKKRRDDGDWERAISG